MKPSSTSERLHSPDRWDALPAVNHPPKRLFLAGTLILAVLLCAWLFLGQIDSRVKGRCILLSAQGVSEIASVAEGRLDGMVLKVGDIVAAGQVIGRLRRADFEQRLDKAKARVLELRVREHQGDGLINVSKRFSRSAIELEQTTVAARLATVNERLAQAAARVQVQQRLFDEGLATRSTLLAAQDQREALMLEQANLKSRSKQLSFQLQEEQRGLNGESNVLAFQVSQAERELALLESHDDLLMKIRSPYAGKIIEIKAQNGTALTNGAPVVSIELAARGGAAAPLVAVIFVNAGDGKLLAGGMAAEITPTNVKRQEFGFIRAAIGEVSSFPASKAGIAQMLQNPDVAKELTGERATTQVQAALLALPHGGYQWSGAARVPPSVFSGSMCSAEVVVREQHPVDMVLPFVRKVTGIL